MKQYCERSIQYLICCVRNFVSWVMCNFKNKGFIIMSMNKFFIIGKLRFLFLFFLLYQIQYMFGTNYVLKSDFEKILTERNNDISLNDSLKVFGLSELYTAYIGKDELAVYNYYKNRNIIKKDYIWRTTTNNHWVQMLLEKSETKILEVSLHGNQKISELNTKIVGMDGIPISFIDNKMIIKIDGGTTRRGMVIVNGNENEPLFIFVDQPDDFLKTDSTVIFEGYNTGTFVVPYNIKKIHIPLGSYYRGNIISDHDIEISGFGIISQEGIKHSGYEEGEDNPIKCNISVRGNNTKMNINGITSIEPAMYHFWVWPGYGTLYEDVKSFSFLYETDAYIGSYILDCFSKVNDDHIKLYISNTIVERFYTYLQGNGHSFQFGWGDYGSRKNIRVKDVMVYRDLNNLEECKYIRSFINWRKPDFPNIIENVCFDNIRFYGPVKSFLVIDNDGNSWKSNPVIKDFVIRNIFLTKEPYCTIKLENPSFHLEIENIYLKNKKITKENLKEFISEKSNNNIEIR